MAMIGWSDLVQVGRRFEANRARLKAVLWAPFSMPVIGLAYSLVEPMPGRPITTALEVLEYSGLFALGALVLGFPLGLLYGYPALWFSSKFWVSKVSRLFVTLVLAVLPPLAIVIWLQEVNYFTNVCLVMSLTTALCAQLLLFRLETIDAR